MTKSKKVKVFPILNTYCHRTCYFVLPENYDKRGKSLEQIYADCMYANFDQKTSGRLAIRYNLSL